VASAKFPRACATRSFAVSHDAQRRSPRFRMRGSAGNRKCNTPSRPGGGARDTHHHYETAPDFVPWSLSGSAKPSLSRRQAIRRKPVVPYNYTGIGVERVWTVRLTEVERGRSSHIAMLLPMTEEFTSREVVVLQSEARPMDYSSMTVASR